MAVLLWGLRLYELPSDDQLVSPDELFNLTQLFDSEGARQFVAGAALRPVDELFAYRTHILMLHLRLCEFRLRPNVDDRSQLDKLVR